MNHSYLGDASEIDWDFITAFSFEFNEAQLQNDIVMKDLVFIQKDGKTKHLNFFACVMLFSKF